MEKIAEWYRWEIFLTTKDWKRIIIKKALDQTKKASIQREIVILQKINKLWIKCVPKILDFGEDYFEEEYIDWQRFDKIFDKSNKYKQNILIQKLLENCYNLDKFWIVHWELSRPFNNVLVSWNNVYIIDFERWHINDFSGKNMKNFAQWLKNKKFLTIEDLLKIGKIKDIKIIKMFIKNKINMKNNIKTIIYLILLLAFDQITKYIFFDMKILEWVFVFNPVLNTWIAWSIPIDYIFVYIISILALIVFYYLYHKKTIWMWEFILFSAGTIGNLFDRVFLWWVRDFIDLRYWPVFNLADMYLTFAVLILIYKEFFGKNLSRPS